MRRAARWLGLLGISLPALTADVIAWGKDIYYPIVVPADLPAGADQLAVGAHHALVRYPSGVVRTFGWAAATTNKPPADLPAVQRLDAGYDTSYALLSDGTIRAWGDLGGSGAYNLTPRNDLGPFQDIFLDWQYALAQRLDGSLVGWGDRWDGVTLVPADLGTVAAIATGTHFAMALRTDGQVRVWGADVGVRDFMPPAVHDVVAIGSGSGQALAVRCDGIVVHWGFTADEIGPPPASALDVVAAAAGLQHAAVLTADGRVICWGMNDAGQSTVPAGLDRVTQIGTGHYFTAALRSSIAVRSSVFHPALATPAGAIPLRFVFSAPVMGFAASDIAVANGRISRFAMVDTQQYEADLVPAAPGPVEVQLAAGACSAIAGGQPSLSLARTIAATLRAVPVTAATRQGQAVDIPLAVAEDVAGVSYVLAAPPQHGIASIAGGVATYQPEPGFSGTDQFQIQADNGGYRSLPVTVTVTVAFVNQPPTVDPVAAVTLYENEPLTFTVTGLGPGGTSAAELAQTLSLGAASSVAEILAAPAVTYVGGAATAQVTLRSAADAFGSATAALTIQDSGGIADGGQSTTTVSWPVTILPVNSAPRFTCPANLTVAEGSGPVMLAITDIASGPPNEGDQTLTLTATSSDISRIPAPEVTYDPVHGTGTIRLSFAPYRFTAQDLPVTVFVLATDTGGIVHGGRNQTSQPIQVVITPVNDPPQATAATLAADPGATVVVGVATLSVSDPDDPSPTSLACRLAQVPVHGDLVLRGRVLVVGDAFTQADLASGGDLVYRHDATRGAGDDDFAVLLDDGIIATPIGPVTVPIAVYPTDRPILQDAPLSVPWSEGGGPVAVAPTVRVVAGAPVWDGGSLQVDAIAGWRAGDRLSVAHLGTGAGEVGVVDAAVLYGGRVCGSWSGGTEAPLLVRFAGADATRAAVEAVARAVRFDHATRDPGADARTIRLVVDDVEHGASRPATVPVTVMLVDDPPVPRRLTVVTAPGVARPFQALADDPDSTALSWSIVTPPATHVVEIVDATAGRFRFVPAAGVAGADQCVLAVADGHGSASLVVPLAVASQQAPRPLAASDPPREAVTGDVLRHELRFDGSLLSGAVDLDFLLLGDAPAGMELLKTGPTTARLTWSVPAGQGIGLHRMWGVLAVAEAQGAAAYQPMLCTVVAPPGGNQ